MKLINLQTYEEFDAEGIDVEPQDYKHIALSQAFIFDWSKERVHQVFKLVSAEAETFQRIHGLISLSDIPEEFRIHINLIENANSNKSPNKQIDRVAGCLLAFATQVAFEKGYFGFVSLIPKTKLIPLYVEKYGFSRVGQQLAIEGQAAVTLIQQYL